MIKDKTTKSFRTCFHFRCMKRTDSNQNHKDSNSIQETLLSKMIQVMRFIHKTRFSSLKLTRLENENSRIGELESSRTFFTFSTQAAGTVRSRKIFFRPSEWHKRGAVLL